MVVRTPVLVIDGVDLIAKSNGDLFLTPIDRAKYLVNLGVLRIVFVSSEGSVLPLVDKISSCSRISNFLEIFDISDEDAETYLCQSMPEDLAKDIVVLTGGCFIHLLAAICKYNALIQKQNTVHLAEIRDYLFARMVRSGMVKILEQPQDLRHIEKNMECVV